jgi:hypothetical protein
MDNILILSIFLVFITALVGSFFQHRKRDRVLTEFQDYQIILQLQEDQKVWGRMDVFPNGLELHYARPYKNNHGNSITSYILFSADVEQIVALLRRT